MIPFLLKSTLILGLVFALYKVLLEREKLPRFKRAYLLLGLVVAFGLPLVTVPVYVAVEAPAPKQVLTAIELPNPQISDAVAPQPEVHKVPQTIAPKPAPVVETINYLPYVLWGIYGLVTVLLAIRFTVNIAHFYRKAKRNKRVALQGATVVLLNDCPLPYTFMNFIFVNESQYEGKTIEAELLTHELAHVRQKHTLDVLFVELLKTVFWFNPLLYLYKKAIQTNHEFLADDAVLSQHVNIPTYQLLLLDKAMPPLAYALASSINFSTTKKRFTMMTKTTTKAKGLLLQSAMLPVAAGLVYFFSVQTITYAKTTEGKTNPTISFNQLPKAFAPAGQAETEQSIPVVTQVSTETTFTDDADTLAGDTRRDEYFKGVRIIIDDKPRGIKVDAPYESVSLDNRRYYLNNVPEKKSGREISDADYQFSITQKNAIYYVDERKVSLEEVLKYNKHDFVSNGFKARGFSKPGVGIVNEFQMFLFTRPFFEKKLRHLNDHYPDKTYVIKVTDVPVDTEKEQAARSAENLQKGMSDLQIDEEKYKEGVSKPTYPYTDELREENKKISAHFPGGTDAFNQYIYSKLKLSEPYSGKKLFLKYTINTDGSISDVKVFDVDDETEKQIAKVLEASPRWIPAQKNGLPYMSTYGSYIQEPVK